MKKEIIICAASVVATLGVTKLPDLLSNVTVVMPPATETTAQESTNTQSDDTTNELLEQILVKLDEDETVAEKETTSEKNESVDDSKTENKTNSATNTSEAKPSTSQATTNTTTQNTTQAKPSTSNNNSSTSSKPTNSQQQTTTASANKNTNTSSSNTTTSKVKTSVARAKEIAIARVGGGTVTEFSQDFDDRVPNYDVTIRYGNAEYDLEISAVDGSILAFDVEYDKVAQKPSSSTPSSKPSSSTSTSKPSNSTSSSTSKPSSTPSSKPSNSTSNIKISAAKAKEIAIAQAGGGTVTDFSQDFDDRVPKYEVTVRNGNTEYDFDISAVDGSILSREVDRENDWD